METMKRQKILVVDDSEINRSILTDILGREFDILEAENGQRALEMIQDRGGELALILLDIVMPVMDGFQVLEGMRDSGWLDEIPVIIMFAENDSSYVRRAYDLGVTECVGRPVEPRVLRRRVANLIMLFAKRERLREIAEDWTEQAGSDAASGEGSPAGERGSFEPGLLAWLAKGEKKTAQEQVDKEVSRYRTALRNVLRGINEDKELGASDRTIRLLQRERVKYRFFASMTREIQFEYEADTDVLRVSEWGAHYLGIQEIQANPGGNPALKRVIGQQALEELCAMLRNSSPGHPMMEYNCPVNIGGGQRWGKIILMALWSEDDPAEYLGAIGKFVDIHEEHSKIEALEQIASHDGLTWLWNQEAARRQIERLLSENRERSYALAVVDLDYFKEANDRHGHLFGDQVLKHLADKLRKSIRSTDLAARVGGDEFLVFMEYTDQLQCQTDRIFRALSGEYEGFPLSVSMGLTRSVEVEGGYDMLFRRADQALYAAKRRGRNCYCFYDDSMRDMLSVLSPIESDIPVE